VNNQEAFDLIWEYFVVDRAPFSIIGNSGEEVKPLYFKSKGVYCPIGLLISEDDYTSIIEGQSIDEVYHMLPSLEGIEQELLLVIQLSYDVHATDYATGVQAEKKARQGFKNDLRRKIAKKFKLDIPKREKGRSHGNIRPVRRST